MTNPVWLVLTITVAFAVLARLVRAVSTSGAIAGAIITFLLCFTAGWGAFAGVATVFLLALVTTRLGYSRKQILGTAERRSGRDAWQILANLGVAATCGLLSTIGPQREIWLMGTVAALAEAAADTASSEAGQAAADAPYLITTWEQVPVGTNGAISLPGTLAGLAAASLVSLVCGSAGLLRQPSGIAMAVGAGILGMFADSYLGALWERRRRLTNNQVNFLSTAVAAALAMLLRLCS